MVSAEGVLEPAMGSAGINQERMADLAYIAEALDCGRIEG
jgi:hypothetical protein